MVVAVFPCLVDKLGVIPRKELNGVQRLEVFGIIFCEESAKFFACEGIVLIEGTMILVAIQFDEIEFAAVGRPSDVGEVAVGGVARVEIDGLVGL